MTNETNYELTDFNSGKVLDTGRFRYDGYFHHLLDKHKGAGMICDVLDNSYLDEYLSHVLVEHVDSITDDELTIYIHDYQEPIKGDYPYDTTPAFCIPDDDGDGSLADLKPYMVLRCFDLEYVIDPFDDDD